MRTVSKILLLVLSVALPAAAQNVTTVSATIVDPNGLPYSNAAVQVQLLPIGVTPTIPPPCNGQSASPCVVSAFQSLTTDVNGTFSVNLASNAVLSPGGTQWQFTVTITGVPLPFGTGPQKFSTAITISGATQNISATLNALAPALAHSTSGTSINTYTVATLPGAPATNTLAIVTDGNGLSCTTGGGTNSVLCQYNGTIWVPVSGGTGVPGTPVNSLQKDVGGVFTASACLETLVSSLNALNCNDDGHFRGPNPNGVDMTFFGVRAVNPSAIPATTATITSGLNTATVASNAGFQQGDGFSIVGAGTAQSMTTPAAPTVTPSCAANLTGMGYTVPAGAGSTAYAYHLAMRDQGQGITAASASGTTSTGNASLGANNTTWTSSASGASNVFTATVGSTANLAAGCLVVLKGSTDDAEFGGWKIVASVVDGTHFTYNSGIDASRGISTTTATGGTVYYWLCNHVVLPTPGAGGTQFLIYGRTAGSLSLIGSSLIANIGVLMTDASYLSWDDYGPTMMGNFPVPWWAPTTPPASPVNDTLATTITNISGTTFTLAASASTSVTSASARFDNTPGILAAQAASFTNSTGGGGTIHFPVVVENSGTGNNTYVTSTYLPITAAAVIQDGGVCVGDTIQLTGFWLGTHASAKRLVNINNGLAAHIPVSSCGGANPTFYVTAGGISDVSVFTAGNGTVGVFNANNSNSSTRYENDNFSSANASNGYMDVAFYDFQQTSPGGFGGKIRNSSFLGASQVVGVTSTPSFASKYNTEWNFDWISCYGRGFFFVPYMAGLSHRFHMGEECQGPSTPLVTIASELTGTTGGNFTVQNALIDTGGVPILANLTPNANGTAWNISIQDSNLPSSAEPAISGNLIGGSVNFINTQMGTQAGQNYNVNIIGAPGVFGAGFGETMISISGNHLLNGSEGGVISTATGTITAPHALVGQVWDVYSQAGTTTLAIDSGTLYNPITGTGPFTIPNGAGVRVACNGTNCYAYGFGSSGAGPTLQTNSANNSSQTLLNLINSAANAIGGTLTATNTSGGIVKYELGGIINATGGGTGVSNPQAHTIGVPQGSAPWNFIGPGLTGQTLTANNAGDPSYNSPGIAGRTVSIATDTILCDSGTVLQDRARTEEYTANVTITVPDAGSSGCSANFVTSLLIGSGVTATVNRTTSSTFTIYNGGSVVSGATSFTLTAGQFATLSSRDNANWIVRVTTQSATSINGSAVSGVNGDVTTYGPGNTLADSGFLATNVVRKDAANTGAAAMTLDLSAATGSNAFKLPVLAGCTAGANGAMCYDPTGNSTHERINAADAIGAGFSSAPAGSKCIHTSGTTGLVTETGSDCPDSTQTVTAAAAATAPKQVCVSSGASKTCSYIDYPETFYVPAANCVNATAASAWSTGATPASLCRAGTNNKDGLLSPWGASDVGYFKVHLPNDWDSGASLDISIDLTSTDTTNGHTIIMQAATACAKGDGSTTDDVAFNTAQSFGTITLNGNANRTWNATLTGLTKTGCIAGSTLWLKISRTTDTATNVGVYGATVDLARLITVQAN